jgi:hypothetical protein
MVKTIFYGTERSHTDKVELSVYCNHANEITILMRSNGFPEAHISLDKSTAIKFHRELKKQISFITENLQQDGK